MSYQKPYNLEQNIAIRACAGAGKTYTLAWRYMVILDNFAAKSKQDLEQNWLGPANILAITFTKKATVELNQRIHETLSSILNGKKDEFPVDIRHSYTIYIQKTKSQYR